MPTSRRIISRLPIPELPGYELRTLELTIAPGHSPAHTHPRASANYIVKGELHEQFEGGPMEQHKERDGFHDLADMVHQVIFNPSETEDTVIVVSYVIPVDLPNVVPLAEKGK